MKINNRLSALFATAVILFLASSCQQPVGTSTASSSSSNESSEITESCLDGIWVSDIPLSGDYLALKFTVSSKTAAGNTGTTKQAAIDAISGSIPYTYSGTTATIADGDSTIYFKLTSTTTADYYSGTTKLGPFTKQSSSGSGSGSTTEVSDTSYTEASDSLCESVIQLPAGTDGTAGTSGTYVLFGSWPQTIKAVGVSISTTQTKTMGANTYYLGSDGYWYAKVKATPFGSGYTFTDTNTVTTGTEYYFKVEPIKWLVLESRKLFAESILANVAYYPYSDVNRSIDSKTVYPNNYQYSRIRAYLNGLSYTEKASDTATQAEDSEFSSKGFLQTAFTTTAQAKIATTTVDNSAIIGGVSITPYACDNTNDKIYLLSVQEGISCASRVDSDYARAMGAYMDTTAGDYQFCGDWWLRLPGSAHGYDVKLVCSDGLAVDSDVYGNMGRVGAGVVPALTLAQ